MAHADPCAHPCRTAPGVDVVLVLRGHIGIVHPGVYKAVRQLCGDGHDAPIIGQ